MLRLIGEKGEQLGVMETRRAIGIARDQELDVVVISENANPPVAKIVDLNKYAYKEQQRKKAQAKQARVNRIDLKEMQFDFEVKTNKIKKFLNKGDHVKIIIRFKGRERFIYGKSSLELFDRISKSVNKDFDSVPKFVGSSIVAIIK